MPCAEAAAIGCFPALGGIATVAVSDAAALDEGLELVSRLVASLDAACSRFRPDSELTALNNAGGRETRVSPLLLQAIRVALEAARLTSGRVDPTLGGALVRLGYDRRWEEMRAAPATAPAPLATPALRPAAGWRAVQFDEARSTVRLPRGVQLDLGATAKAWGAERAAATAARRLCSGVLVGLSGDIALAGAAPPGGWRVRVTDDHRAGTEAAGQWISLRCGGLATSSTTVRRWWGTHGAAHHVIDPATGTPVAEVWRTVTVAAATCLEANIASTAALVHGTGAIPWLDGLGLPARLVSRHATVHHRTGWPAQGDDLR